MNKLVLIVDDEPGILTTLSSVLVDEGFDTICTKSGEEALDLYRLRRPDVVFLDIWLPDRDGLETLQALREMDPSAAVVMMSGHGTASTAVKAIKMGAFDCVEKPVDFLARLLMHVPEPRLHTIRYYGRYSNVARARSRELTEESADGQDPTGAESEFDPLSTARAPQRPPGATISARVD